MLVVIAGAGSVGRSIARELLAKGHDVTVIDREPDQMRVASVAQADWVLADACSPDALSDAGVAECDVIVAATGDDKANLVISLLAKTQFGVPQVVARVNNPKNEWMFDSTWGVDVPVSTPRVMTALVEEAVSVGALVRLFHFREASTALYAITLAPQSRVIGQAMMALPLPSSARIVAMLRNNAPIALDDAGECRPGDELIVMLDTDADDIRRDVEEALR